MSQIAGFNIPGTTKFTRPVFGDGRVYVGTTEGFFYGFGSPVNLPLNCNPPYDFGIANVNQATSPKKITCIANIAVIVTNLNSTGNPSFGVKDVPSVPRAVGAGQQFSFEAYFNPKAIGLISVDLAITTTNGVAGYNTQTPISLRGIGQSVDGLLQNSPITLAFAPAIAEAGAVGVSQTASFTNLGDSSLTIKGIQYSSTSDVGPFIPAAKTSAGPRMGPFTFIDLPSTIPGNSTKIVTVHFDTTKSGNFAAYLKIQSDGGTIDFDVVGTSGSAPIAQLEFQATDAAGWVGYHPGKSFTFGSVTEDTTRSLKMRLKNNAPSGSARLSITVSKPPFGLGGLIEANNDVDLSEGTTLAPGDSATANIYCSVPKAQRNTDPYQAIAYWTLNVNDPNFGKQVIKFDCLGVSEQAPPLQSNGVGVYRYIGCFKEDNTSRQLQTQIYSDPGNDIAKCIAACTSKSYIFCGAQYKKECWGGSTIPKQKVDNSNCNFPCAGNAKQICGGNGAGIDGDGTYISLFADSSRFSGKVSSTPSAAPGSSFIS